MARCDRRNRHPLVGEKFLAPVFAGWFAQNGNGEMTGTTWVEESGFLEGPVMITNTHSVGIVRDSVIAWQVNSAAAQQLQRRLLVPPRRRRDL